MHSPEEEGVSPDVIEKTPEHQSQQKVYEQETAEVAREKQQALMKEIASYEGEGGSELAQQAKEVFDMKADTSREKVEKYLASAELSEEAVRGIRESFENLDFADEDLDEQRVATMVGAALEQHFSADLDEIMDAASDYGPAFLFAANARDAYKAVMDEDETAGGAARKIWRRVAKGNPLLAPLEYTYRLGKIATTEGEDRAEHVQELKDFASDNSLLWKFLLKDSKDLAREGRLRAQMSSEALAVLAPFTGGMGMAVAVAVKGGERGMSAFSERLSELERRAGAGEKVTKADLLRELSKGAIDATGKSPEELVVLAAETAIGSGKVESEGAKLALELMRARPEIATNMAKGVGKKLSG